MLNRARPRRLARSIGVQHLGCRRFALPEPLRGGSVLRPQLQIEPVDGVSSSDKFRSIGISRRKGDHLGAEIYADQRSDNEGCSDQGSRNSSGVARFFVFFILLYFYWIPTRRRESDWFAFFPDPFIRLRRPVSDTSS